MISVIIPTFNRGVSIRKAITSVLKQSYRDIECIVVDDGSTDGTGEVVRSIKDGRVRYIRYEKNCGACHARNVGIDNALGEYLAFQDSDDDWVETKLEEQLSFLQSVNADLVFCQLQSREKEKVKYYPTNKMPEGLITHQQAMSSFMGSTQTFLGKAECIRKVRFDEDMPRFQDWDFLIRFTSKYKLYYQKKPLALQILGKDSISNNPNKGYRAICRMIGKYSEEMNRKNLSNLYMLKGTFLSQMDQKGADRELIYAISMNPFSLKSGVKLLLCKLGLLSRWYRR